MSVARTDNDGANNETVLEGLDAVWTAIGEKGVDVETLDSIWKGVWLNNSDVLKEMLDNDLEGVLDCRDDNDRNLLHSISNSEVLAVVLEHASDELINAQDIHGHTPLIDAVRGNEYDKVKLLLEEGASVYTSDHDQWNAMHYAASYRSDECVIDLLLEADESDKLFGVRNRYGQTPWDLAEENGYSDTIRSVIAEREKAQIVEALSEHMTPSELYAQGDVQQAPSSEVRQKTRRAM